MSIQFYPFLLYPVLHVKVWGGRKLETHLYKVLPTSEEPYGESWELHDACTVANGALAGRTLGDLLREHGAALVGEGHDPAAGFPLLAKLLDAADWLSIQVHPNDAQAAELEGEPRGKTEAWLVLHAEPGAQIVIGVQNGITRQAMADAIRAGTLEQHVVYADVSAGDVLLLKANTVHALGPGLLVYEIQQSSDTTYRLYDWNRAGLDGKPRQLHIEKGVRVSNVDYLPQIMHPAAPDSGSVTLVESAYFRTDLHRLDAAANAHEFATGGTFHALTCTRGEVTVTGGGAAVTFTTGQTVLIPAALAAFSLAGRGEVLQSCPVR